jgi:hypothetical protein
MRRRRRRWGQGIKDSEDLTDDQVGDYVGTDESDESSSSEDEEYFGDTPFVIVCLADIEVPTRWKWRLSLQDIDIPQAERCLGPTSSYSPPS